MENKTLFVLCLFFEEPKRKTKQKQQSPFKVPDRNGILLLKQREKEQKEEMRKFLALPIDKKTFHAAQMTSKLRKELAGELEEEGKEKTKEKSLKQNEGKTTPPKQQSARHKLKMAMMKRENVTRDSKHDLISMERLKAVLELSLMTKRCEIEKMDQTISKQEKELKQLETMIEKDNLSFEEFLRENEKKSVEARTFFEQEAKSKQEKNAEIKKLTAEIGTIKSDLIKFEETLVDYRRYKELLFKLAPPEWQEAQKVKKRANKDLSDKDMKDETTPVHTDSATMKESSSDGGEPLSVRENPLSTVYSETRITGCEQDDDSSEYEDEPELYFTDPQQLLDLVNELTEQNLSLIQNSTRLEEMVDELQQSIHTAEKKIEQDEEQLTRQITDINQKILQEKARGNRLKQKVQLHVSLNTEDQDMMLDSLGEKVSAVHRTCVNDRMTNLSTLEKLASIENHLSLLLQSLENIPEENLVMMKKIKDSERRAREREEKLRQQREKQKERMRRYLERSLADSKRASGRKLMPRYMPVVQKVKVTSVENIHAEDELHAYLFTSDDME
uniref:Cilia and flagella associated protein 100 n=1 Tax=Cynoglossus semilaevis TaxID=244447 RepID=A0A3P8W787_CYNSE